MRPLSPNGIIRTGDYILRSRLYIVRFRFYIPIYPIPIMYFDIPDRVCDHFPPVCPAAPAPKGALSGRASRCCVLRLRAFDMPRYITGYGYVRRTTAPAHAPRSTGQNTYLYGGRPLSAAQDMIEIRKASAGDIPAIQSVAQVAFPATYAGIISPAQTDYMMEWMYSTASLLRQMTDEGHVYYVAREEDGTPVGYVSVQREGEDRFHLQKIYVLPDRQGRQIGRMLFGEALRAVKESHPGPCTLELNVNRSNRARGFYEKMGMRVVREGDFPIGEGYYMNDYIMGMEL